MDAFLTAFIGDIASRSLSFLIDRYLKKEEPTKEERLDNLQRLLLRVRVVVEEAGERHVTNQAMLQQLSTLRKEMYKGYYTLDTFRCQQPHHEHDEDDRTGKKDVLPIIGPGRVGKSTLVEHACNDERVRDHFSQIMLFTRNDLAGESAASSLRDGCGVVKHHNRDLEGQRMLIVVELDGDKFTQNLDDDTVEALWQRLYSAYKNCIPRGSKIIVTSRSDKIASFGTTVPLRLQFLSREAYWYLFKVLTFGAMDAAEHPKLASVAMDMAVVLNGCFLSANIFSGLLRSNIDVRFWSAALAILQEFKQRNIVSGLMRSNVNVRYQRVNSAVHIPSVSEHIVILDDYQQMGSAAPSVRDEAGAGVPRVTAVDIMFGRVRPRGKFDVLAWRSHLPPHYSYVVKCEMQTPKQVVARKKRAKKIGG
ncbi:hypothetical protein BAE44_0025947 [Dichanthelium oligosanthes]|uniref:NB-ARC domain-containing protein n=1 Tax=Dichanthelium oligosanthes TaxID=888268 RepID=A0A1E5UJI1_9POAL|nr:hypothetical protein BAE44_0025947 [Dichanthelium oligosanthes]